MDTLNNLFYNRRYADIKHLIGTTYCRKQLDLLITKGELLHLAAKYVRYEDNNHDIIQWLLQQGVDINETDKHGQTPITVAVKCDNLYATCKLLTAGCANTIDQNMTTNDAYRVYMNHFAYAWHDNLIELTKLSEEAFSSDEAFAVEQGLRTIKGQWLSQRVNPVNNIIAFKQLHDGFTLVKLVYVGNNNDDDNDNDDALVPVFRYYYRSPCGYVLSYEDGDE